MNHNSTDKFEYLRQWSSLPDLELNQIISEKTIAVVKELAIELENEDKIDEIEIKPENFVSHVRRLNSLLIDGSNLLSQAIKEASDYQEKGKREDAIDVYKRFISNCGSKFYRGIARGQIKKLKSISIEVECKDNFDYLNLWSSLTDGELEQIISEKTLLILKELAVLFESEEKLGSLNINAENFIDWVRRMRKLQEDGAKMLAHAVIEAAEYQKKGEKEKAIEVYKRFVSSCASKYFRDIAREYIKNPPSLP